MQRAARVGDLIDYADGTRARIITGIDMPGRPDMAYAIAGSLLDNGDVINDSPAPRCAHVNLVGSRGRTTSRTFAPVRDKPARRYLFADMNGRTERIRTGGISS